MAALAVAMVLPGIVAVVAGVHLYGSPCCSYGAAWYCCGGCWSSSLWQPLPSYGAAVAMVLLVLLRWSSSLCNPCCSYGAA